MATTSLLSFAKDIVAHPIVGFGWSEIDSIDNWFSVDATP